MNEMANLQTSFNASHNYTSRVRVNQKEELFKIRFDGKENNRSIYKITYDIAALLDNAKVQQIKEVKVVAEAYEVGEIYRVQLVDGETEQTLEINSAAEKANPTFRILVISTGDDKGKILASTSDMKVKVGEDPGEEDADTIGIFEPNLVPDLDGKIWRVRWPDNDLVIEVCQKYFMKYQETEIFSAHVFPEVVRSIAQGLLLRFNDESEIDKDSNAAKWSSYFQSSLGFQMGEGEYQNPYDLDIDDKLEYAEQIVSAFTTKRWRNENTLLEALLK